MALPSEAKVPFQRRQSRWQVDEHGDAARVDVDQGAEEEGLPSANKERWKADRIAGRRRGDRRACVRCVRPLCRLTVDWHQAGFRYRPVIDLHATAHGRCAAVPRRTVQHVPTVEEPAY